MWSPPEPGDIVWCRFPERVRDVPGPKPRPALVVTVTEHEDGYAVKVAYGTSKKVNQLVSGEFAIRKLDSLPAYTLAGLSFDTKFNLREMVDLPWNHEFFGVPPHPSYGQTPKLGSLHACLMKALTLGSCWAAG